MNTHRPTPSAQGRLACAVAIALLSAVSLPTRLVSAQAPQAITAYGFIESRDGSRFPLSLTFRPAGGPVTGSVDYHYARTFGDTNCNGSVDLSLRGMFPGGDSGLASGSADGTLRFACDDGSFHRANYRAEWSGAFHADGTAGGGWVASQIPVDDPAATVSRQGTWSITYSPTIFQAASSPTITATYIYAAYGVRVMDSPKNPDGRAVAWSASEVSLLNDVLKRLPAPVMDKVPSVALIRSEAEFDGRASAGTSRLATYLACDLEISPECKRPSASIRIFDQAHVPFDFVNDPHGDVQFKATILHELAHGLEDYREPAVAYAHSPRGEAAHRASSLLEDWIAATRTVTDTSDPNYWTAQNGWERISDRWLYFNAPGNRLPTRYASGDPAEDLAESVMLYVFDPVRLLTSSSRRYNFVRDRIFSGVEYLSGAPREAVTILHANPGTNTSGSASARR